MSSRTYHLHLQGGTSVIAKLHAVTTQKSVFLKILPDPCHFSSPHIILTFYKKMISTALALAWF
jgi:hypothetical protein